MWGYYKVGHEEQENLARSLQVNLVQYPSTYLGIDFKMRSRRVTDFQFLVDKLNSKVQVKDGKQSYFLKLEEQPLILLSSKLCPLIYTFSCFKVPETICYVDILCQ